MFFGDRRPNITSRMVGYSSRDPPYKSDEQQGHEYSPHIAYTLRRLKAEFRNYKVDNSKLIKVQDRLSIAQEKQPKFNSVMFQSLLDLQRQG